MSDPREEFVDLVAEIQKMRGLDNLSACLVGELFVEPGELSLQELAEKTGYSLSAVSSSMKNLTDCEFIKRTKKPGSKKIYFHIEKSWMKNFLEVMSEKHRSIVEMVENKIPTILEEYEDLEDEKSKREKEIIKRYYREIEAMNDIFEKFIEEVRKKHVEMENE
ncbi:MAG: GbsR/MarR family transcriptional regulator [Candidatus Aenigmatarchaeota archaeon]